MLVLYCLAGFFIRLPEGKNKKANPKDPENQVLISELIIENKEKAKTKEIRLVSKNQNLIVGFG